jgi:cysteine-rich repeat protein
MLFIIRKPILGTTLLLAAMALFATPVTVPMAGCGGGACGNGKVDPGEQCDDGNHNDLDGCSNACLSQHTATVKWSLLANEAPMFNQNCTGVQASKIQLVLNGPDAMTQPQTIKNGCTDFQYPFGGLKPGSYTITATLFDATGAALTKGMTSANFTITNADVEVDLDFQLGDFSMSYMGNYFFRTKWGGADTCTGAMPPVTQQIVKLEEGGSLVAMAKTDNGEPADGVTPGPCRAANMSVEEFPQKINMIPWGPAKITVTGLDSGGTPQFMKSFDTFVGAGISNPEIILDVQSLAPDAGPMPDAPIAAPDAGPIDAGVHDAAP